ncbi:hypothetical protein PRO82_000341 [Candidatus Protochlamydia amoebophila]|nr:hypothetical protein [Candidatus Protochlamydia amoebophila]
MLPFTKRNRKKVQQEFNTGFLITEQIFSIALKPV